MVTCRNADASGGFANKTGIPAKAGFLVASWELFLENLEFGRNLSGPALDEKGKQYSVNEIVGIVIE